MKEGFSVRAARHNFGVPRSTLQDKLKNPDSNSKPGPSTVLSEEEEKEICNWIKYRAEAGFPVTQNHLLDCIQSYLTKLEKTIKLITDLDVHGGKNLEIAIPI